MKLERPDFIIKPRLLLSLGGQQENKVKYFSVFFALIGLLCLVNHSPHSLSFVRAALPHNIEWASMAAVHASVCTVLRMVIAVCAATVLAGLYAVLAYKNRYIQRVCHPLLGGISTVPSPCLFFLITVGMQYWAPRTVYSAEWSIFLTLFAILWWRLAESFYEAVATLPTELAELGSSLKLTSWQFFWTIECPYALPLLISKMTLTMAEAWFVLIFMEGFLCGRGLASSGGIGAYAYTAAELSNAPALCAVVCIMLFVLVCYDQLIGRPLTAWSRRFVVINAISERLTDPWFLRFLRRNQTFEAFAIKQRKLWHCFALLPLGGTQVKYNKALLSEADVPNRASWLVFILWGAVGLLGGALALLLSNHSYSIDIYGNILVRGCVSLARIILMLCISSLVWVPIGVYVGTKPAYSRIGLGIAQYFAVYPANLLYPLFAMVFIATHRSVEVWGAPLLIFGGQWAIFSAVLAGMRALPSSVLDVSKNFQVRGWLLWRKILLPALLPYYFVGLGTASASAWTAMFAVETLSWGHVSLQSFGLGAYIFNAANTGEVSSALSGICIMTLMLMVTNLLFWQPITRFVCRVFKITDRTA